MKGKFFIYILSTVLVIWSMDSVNINKIFKKIKNHKLDFSTFYLEYR